MNASSSPAALQQKIGLLETQVRHLKNELQLSRTEYQNLISNYYDIFSKLEKMVEERTHELKQVKSQLENKTQELEIMLDISPALIFYKDVHGRYLRANQRFADFLNLPIQTIVGKMHAELFAHDPSIPFGNDDGVIRSGRPVLRQRGGIETPDGFRYLLIDKIPYKNAAGEVIGIIGFALDVTDQEKIRREKHELQEKLARSQKMESLGLLAGGVAHDLNNVLTGFVSYPEFLLMELPADSDLRGPIKTIQESGQKAAAIVQDLLTLARRGVTHTEVLNLNEIVTGYTTSPEHQHLAAAYPAIKLEMHLDGDLLNIKGAAIHLRKTVMNLMTNAFEAQPDGGCIQLRTYNCYVDQPLRGYDEVQEGDYAVLEISDQGIGIAPEDLNRIFEPFYTRKVMGRSGTGLGMAVVWGTVQDHGGYIDVVSRERQGTAFRLFFPITREMPTKKTDPLPVDAYRGRGESILVVDDIREQREIATSLLRKLGYRTTAAASGAQAVALLAEEAYDLVVLDMIMDPGIDGLETYRRMLALRPAQRAIIASGYSENERVREAQRLGAGTYVKKPYLLEKFGVAVRCELDRPVQTATCDPASSSCLTGCPASPPQILTSRL